MSKCKCGNDKENWQEVCKICYAQQNGSKRQLSGHLGTNKDRDIHRQVFLKIASEQRRGASVTDLVKYAQDLEGEYESWSCL